MSKFWNFIFTVIIAGLAGILASQFLVPYLAHTSPFNQISWLKKVNSGTTIINRKEEKIIKEDTAIEDAISRISPSVVGIASKGKLIAVKKPAQETTLYGTGFIVTSDGLIIAASSTVPEKNFISSIIKDNTILGVEVIKRDNKSGLVLLKIQQSNLPVVSFADAEGLRLGERVVLFGFSAAKNPIDSSKTPPPSETAGRFVNWGIIKTLSEQGFQISIEQEILEANGAPIINVQGEVVGMALLDEKGKIRIVTADAIKEFLSS